MLPNCEASGQIVLHCSQAQLYSKRFTYSRDFQCSRRCSFSYTGAHIISTDLRSQSTTNKDSSINLEYLKRDLEYQRLQSILEISRKTYHQGQFTFLSFCHQHNMSPYPLQKLNLRLFASHLARTVSYATIHTYLAAVANHHIEL